MFIFFPPYRGEQFTFPYPSDDHSPIHTCPRIPLLRPARSFTSPSDFSCRVGECEFKAWPILSSTCALLCRSSCFPGSSWGFASVDGADSFHDTSCVFSENKERIKINKNIDNLSWLTLCNLTFSSYKATVIFMMKHGGLMVCGWSGPVTRPSRDHALCSWTSTLLSHISLHPGITMGTGEFNAWVNLRWTSVPSRGE